MDYRTRHQAEAVMAAWAETSDAPALALIEIADTKRFRVLETDADGTLILRRAETVVEYVWTRHSAGITHLTLVNAYSIGLCYPIWQVQEQTVLVPHGSNDLRAALSHAVSLAHDSTDWRTVDDPGPTFIDALAEGSEVDPWRNDARARIPEDLTEEGPRPIVLIRMAGGRIDDVSLVTGDAHVVATNRDGEALDRGPHLLLTDDQGERLLTRWTGPDELASLPSALVQKLGLKPPETGAEAPGE